MILWRSQKMPRYCQHRIKSQRVPPGLKVVQTVLDILGSININAPYNLDYFP